MGSLLEHKNHCKANVYLYVFYFYPEVTTFPVVSRVPTTIAVKNYYLVVDEGSLFDLEAAVVPVAKLSLTDM